MEPKETDRLINKEAGTELDTYKYVPNINRVWNAISKLWYK